MPTAERSSAYFLHLNYPDVLVNLSLDVKARDTGEQTNLWNECTEKNIAFEAMSVTQLGNYGYRTYIVNQLAGELCIMYAHKNWFAKSVAITLDWK